MPHPDDHACLKGDLIRKDELPSAEGGRPEEVEVLRTRFKDPFLVRWPSRPGDPAEEPRWAVADELLVTVAAELHADEGEALLREALAPEPAAVRPLPLPGLYLVKSGAATIPAEGPAAYPLAQARALSERPGVLQVSPNYLYFSFPSAVSAAPLAAGAGAQDDLQRMKVPDAWGLGQDGGREVRVAVLDTGLDVNHPYLCANVLRNLRGTVVGWNFYHGNSDVRDDESHGTICAGLIGAGNGIGVCREVSLMPVKFLSSSGCGKVSDAIEAIRFALDHGAHVISNSWGGAPESQKLRDMIATADAEGALFVAGAGNGARNLDTHPYYPAAFDVANVLSVGACDDQDRPMLIRGYGKCRVHLSAPATSVLSTLPTNLHVYPQGESGGTSASAALVAGACALLKAAFPGWSHMQIRQRLLESTALLQGPKNQTDIASCTRGLPDLLRAVTGTGLRRLSCP